MDLLTGEFLQLKTLVDRTLEQMERALSISMPDYSKIKIYLAVIRLYVAELKNFGLDFLVEGSAGCVSISRVIVNNFLVDFHRVLIKCTIIPFHCLTTSIRITTALLMGWRLGPGLVLVPEVVPAPAKKPPAWGGSQHTGASGLAQSHIKKPPIRSILPSEVFWKFCTLRGHSMGMCNRYTTHATRMQCCAVLQVCNRCLIAAHTSDRCFGLQRPSSICLPCMPK
jgi:hypothetical protein